MCEYLVKAYDKMNCEIIAIERSSRTTAITTARYWVSRGATFATVEDKNFDRIYWVNKGGEKHYD